MPPPNTVLNTTKLPELYDFAKAARDNAVAAFRARYPVGATVSWVYESVQQGQVVQQGYEDRLKVRNAETDAVYWVHGWRVIEALRVTT